MEREDSSSGLNCHHPCKEVNDFNCEQHLGWCGVCKVCGQKVHAAYNEFDVVGKQVFRESKLH